MNACATKEPIGFSWEHLCTLVSGHRLFRDANTGRIAIADRSGEMPELTEDGVLWINPATSVTVVTTSVEFGMSVMLGVSGTRVTDGAYVLVDVTDIKTLERLGFGVKMTSKVREKLPGMIARTKILAGYY